MLTIGTQFRRASLSHQSDELCRSSKKLAGPGATAYLGDHETTQIEEIYYEEDISTLVRDALRRTLTRLLCECRHYVLQSS